jgi:hypothetical protein
MKMRSTGVLQSIGLAVEACKQYITITTWIGNSRYHYRIDESSEIYISGRRLEFQSDRGRYDAIRDLYTILKSDDVYKDFVFQVDSLDGPYGEPPRCYNYCKRCQFVISDELICDYFVKIPYDRIMMARKLWISSAPSNRYDYPAMRKRYLNSLYGMGCGYLDTDIIEMAREQWPIENPAQTAYVFGPKYPAINKVIFNAPATIVMWSDGDKTVVKCQDGDKFDPEKGLAMACMKKLLGTNKTGSNYLDVVKGYISKYEEEEKARKEAQKSQKKKKKE